MRKPNNIFTECTILNQLKNLISNPLKEERMPLAAQAQVDIIKAPQYKDILAANLNELLNGIFNFKELSREDINEAWRKALEKQKNDEQRKQETKKY
jgi:hypothetical protein